MAIASSLRGIVSHGCGDCYGNIFSVKVHRNKKSHPLLGWLLIDYVSSISSPPVHVNDRCDCDDIGKFVFHKLLQM
jgi:hypothetical protein